MNNIIIPEEFKRKLKELQKENSVLFVTGHAGVGKTCVVQEYLKNKKITYTYLQADQKKQTQLLPNLNAVLTTYYLRIGKKEPVEIWMRKEAMTNPAYLKEESIDMDSLTSTEKQVLKLLGRGMKNKEIAEFLNVSLNTVAYHTKNIYQKLGVNNRTQATNIAKAMEKK